MNLNPYGTAVISIDITTKHPEYPETIRVKRITLAKYDCVTLKQAYELKDSFIFVNSSIDALAVICEWKANRFI